MSPGWTELARMPSGAYCMAVALVNNLTADFEEPKVADGPTIPTIDDMLIMEASSRFAHLRYSGPWCPGKRLWR